MGDTSLVFSLTTRDQSDAGMRSFRQNVEQESEAASDSVGEAGTSGGGSFAENLKAGVAAGFVAVGALVAAGFTEAMDQSRLSDKLAAQLGLTEAESARVGKVAGSLYADAYGDSFESVNTAVGAVMSSIKGMTDASSAELEGVTAAALDFATAFEIDVTRAASVAGTMINDGLAKDATEAFDLITAASQKVPAALRENVLDAAEEYGQFFKAVGLGGKEAFSLLVEASKQGQFGIDKAGDAIKEFTLLSTNLDDTGEAYKALGLDANQMANDILAGGDTARGATQKIIDGLLAIDDPATQANMAIEFFGTPLEDLGKHKVPKFLEALSGASGSMDDFGGAAARMGDTLNDNAATKIESFKRTLQQNFVEFLGGTVIPAMDGFKQKVADTFGGLWDEAGKGNEEGVDRVLAFFELLGKRLAEKAVEMAPKTIGALTSWGQKVAEFVVANPEQVMKISLIAVALGTVILMLPALIAAAIAGAALTIVVGFVGNLISTTNEKLPEWLDAFVGWVRGKAVEGAAAFDRMGSAIGGWFGRLWSRYVLAPTARTWNSFLGTVRALPFRSVGALAGLGGALAGAAARGWQRFKDASVAKAVGYLAWVRGIPARTASAIGNLGNLLYGKGLDVVRGLWNGIRDMGDWLRGQLSGWAASVIPGPIADALGIGSPSRVMAEMVGRWLPPGIIQGAEETRPQLDRYMATLVNPQTARPAAATPMLARRGGFQHVVVDINLTGADDDLLRRLRKLVHVHGGGIVQNAIGKPGR